MCAVFQSFSANVGAQVLQHKSILFFHDAQHYSDYVNSSLHITFSTSQDETVSHGPLASRVREHVFSTLKDVLAASRLKHSSAELK